MERLKKKALARAPKSRAKKHLDELKRIYGIRKAFIELSIQIEMYRRCKS